MKPKYPKRRGKENAEAKGNPLTFSDQKKRVPLHQPSSSSTAPKLPEPTSVKAAIPKE